jgi:riboflavin synthase
MGAADRNSGHFVQGHVDGTGTILEFKREDDSLWVKIGTPSAILQNVIHKGYIAIDGTSLTVCEVNTKENWFNVMLIQHTQNHVILPKKKVGDLVNLEPDVMGKYAARSMSAVLERVQTLEAKYTKAIGFAALSTAATGILAVILFAFSSNNHRLH